MVYIFTSLLCLFFIIWVDLVGNKSGPKIATLLASSYFYASFGPIIAYYTDNDIYFGIITEQIPRAALLSTLCFIGMATGGLAGTLLRRRFCNSRKARPLTNEYNKILDLLLIFVSAILFLYSVYFFNYVFLPKEVKIFSLNYQLITAWTVVFICRFATTLAVDRVIYISVSAFIFYCVIFSERDFVFIVLSCLVFKLKDQMMNPFKAIPVVLSIFIAIWFLSLGRGNLFDSTFVISILNQGSNLFVNTFILQYVDWTQFHSYGDSYVNSILKTISFNQVNLGPALSSWLVEQYVGEGATGGYGFSIEGEAYMNFGFAGAFFLFFMVGFYISNYLTMAGMYNYSRRIAAVFVTTTAVYSLRNESLNIFKTIFYIILVVNACRIIAGIQRAQKEASRRVV